MTWKPKRPGRFAGLVGGMFCAQLAGAQSIEQLYEAGENRIRQAQAQQDEIDAIVEVIDDRFDDYQVVLKEIEDLEIYNNLLRAQVNGQRRELNELYTAIDEVSVIERQILPLMTRMLTGLEQFIDLDMPFLLDERQARIDAARAALSSSKVSAAEQFRAVMAAWLIEMEDYGTTGEIYTDEIVTPDGVSREVELLRVGRIALAYVTPDDSQAGAWNKRTRQWELLDESMIDEIRAGVEAYRTEQPALFVVPVPAPEEN